MASSNGGVSLCFDIKNFIVARSSDASTHVSNSKLRIKAAFYLHYLKLLKLGYLLASKFHSCFFHLELFVPSQNVVQTVNVYGFDLVTDLHKCTMPTEHL